MYLEYFNLSTLPFSLTPNTDFYCNLPSYQAALNVLLVSLRSGEGFIKITAEVGSGKTLLCRLLMDKLGNEFIAAYIPNPDLSPQGMRRALASELGIPNPLPTDQHQLLTLISEQLIKFHQQNKKVVLLIDEAQALSPASLEGIRLLTNLETKSAKLLQVVLFGQPELETKLNHPSLRQLKQRISFSYFLPPLKKDELHAYLSHRMTIAGCNLGNIFTNRALKLIYKKSRGTPRLVNILAHKALMVAFGKRMKKVNYFAVQLAVRDTEAIYTFNYQSWRRWLRWGSLSLLLIGLVGGSMRIWEFI